MSMADTAGCLVVPSETGFEGRDRSEIGCVLGLVPEPKTFLDRYLVTPEGEIYSLTTGERKYTWLNVGRDALYERVQFSINGRRKNFYVHRLMAELYLPGWDPDFIVNHINGNTLDNAIWNLELGNQSYNIYEAYWKREVYMRLGKIRTNVLMRVGTVHAVAQNKLMEF
jgi:hypothetical protein